jgi:cell volume regulation protein A
VGLRGGVPIVFATYPLIAGIEKAEMIFNLVFFISVTSVLLQGTTLAYVAKLLHLDIPSRAKRRTELEIADNAKTEKIQVEIGAGNPAIGRMVVQLHFPKAAQIMTIKRNGKYIIPVGSTQVKENDKLFILAEDKNTVQHVYESLHLDHPEV